LVVQALSKLTATVKTKIGTGLAPDLFVSFTLRLRERTNSDDNWRQQP
jgi:hypothetical protein